MDPIVGPEFWQRSNEPRPRPPNVKTPTGRPKKKRATQNDIPRDPTKMSRVGTIVKCTYCKAQGHNARTCSSKVITFLFNYVVCKHQKNNILFLLHYQKNDLLKKAAEEGTIPVIPKSTVMCKKCKKQGHNSKTCHQQGEGQGTEGSSTSTMHKQAKKMTPKRKR